MDKNKLSRDSLVSMLREWKWIFRYVRRYKLIILLYIILGVVGTLMSLGASVTTKYLIDAVVSQDGSRLPVYAILTIGMAVFELLFGSLASYTTSIVGTRVHNEIRAEIFSNILNAEWEEIHNFKSGELINRIEGDVSTVAGGVINFIPSVFTKFIQFFGALAIVLYYDKIMALFSLLSAPFMFLISKYLMRTMRKYNKESRELNGKVLSYSEESFRNILVIKSFGLSKQYINNFRGVLDEYRGVSLRYQKFSIMISLGLSIVGLGVSYLCYGWGVYRLWQGLITYGTMTLFLQLGSGLSSSFSSVAGLVPQSITIATSAGRIMEICEYRQEDDADREKALEFLKSNADTGVELFVEDVSFAYRDSTDMVLEDISFSASPGETIGIIGPSGEGKTTLLKLLLGLVNPVSGRIYIKGSDGDILDISDSTRRFISYVPQEVCMFSGSVAENLRIVRLGASDEELEEALRNAGMWDFIDNLPEKTDYDIGEKGGRLSAGQAQRIAIARSLVKKTPILIMDEATSALDHDTEAMVLKNIMKENPTGIRILTTHRRSMLEYCDRVYRINPDGSMNKVR